MRSIERRFAAGAIASAMALVGCGNGPRQVEGLSLVNCDSGPKTAETEMLLRKGQSVKVGGESGLFGGLIRKPLELTSEGNGDIKIEAIQGTNGIFTDSSVIIPDEETLSILAGGVSIRQDHTIVFNSNNIDFEISPSASDGATKLTITEVCTK